MAFGFTAEPLVTVVFISKLDDKARLVLPASIRSKLNLASGDFVSLKITSNGLIELSKAKPQSNTVRNSKNSWEVVGNV